MGVVTRAKKRRLQEEQDLVDRISGLPDGVLGDIVSLLPTKSGARTQLLSSRWRHLWRSAPLNVSVCIYDNHQTIPLAGISGILSLHPGPGRRFSFHSSRWVKVAMAELDGWLRSPSLNNLEELEIHFDLERSTNWRIPPHPLPASALRFSSTLAVASFQACDFPHCRKYVSMPLLRQLTLLNSTISEASLHALLAGTAGCHVLESLLLLNNEGSPRVKIFFFFEQYRGEIPTYHYIT
ncbi:unnamed protein product [Urochloa humidicola]